MFPNDEVVAYGRANGLGSDYNDIMTAFLRDYYSSNLSLTDLWGRAWAEGFRSINGFTDFPGIANSGFYAPLKSTLVLTRGTGNPTYSRATNAWEFDNEGKLILVPSTAARFGGARMVLNLLAATSTLSTQNVTTVATSYTLSFYGTGSVTLSGTATGTLNGTGASNRVQTTVTATAGTLTLTVSGSVTDAQLENVTGQADQTASEYVSVGVLSAPYHGAGVDGVKWFETNKAGTAISEASLLGYHAEGARTNSLLYSRQLALYSHTSINRGTTNLWLSSTAGSELCTNGGFDTDTDWVKDAGWTISGGVASCASGNNDTLYQSATVTPGKQYTINFTLSGVTSGRIYPRIGSSSIGSDYVAANGTYTLTVPCLAGGAAISFETAVSFTGSIDNVSVKEAAIQVTPCTGINNAANSASTLTAGAADATILQTLTLAAAARSFSAYVKRRTGSGSVYITRDGGTNWTDITAQINSTTWTRVKIENTSVLNPSVGFKIATSGDSIDVDCVQDEPGAFVSSPIITTSAAVTRNADSLTYQTASNWSNTAGWMLASVYKPDWSYVAGGVIGSATNGLLPLTTNTGAKAYDGTNTVNGPAGSPSGTVKMAATWGSGALQVAANGTAGTAGSYDGAWGLATIGINTSAGAMYTKNVYIDDAAITAAQLAQVTA